jgi:hypothetical protein
MKVSVVGYRASTADWERVRNLPREQLPPLTPEQKVVADNLKIPEEDYARSALAGQQTQDKLLAKTERFARLLQQKVKQRNPHAVVEHVALITWDHKLEVEIAIDGAPVPLGIDEDIVDDLLEGGSAEADRKLTRIVELAVGQRVA